RHHPHSVRVGPVQLAKQDVGVRRFELLATNRNSPIRPSRQSGFREIDRGLRRDETDLNKCGSTIDCYGASIIQWFVGGIGGPCGVTVGAVWFREGDIAQLGDLWGPVQAD